MQQNIVSLKNVPQTERKKLSALKKRPLFKIKQVFFSSIRFSFTYSFYVPFYFHLEEHVRPHARGCSNSVDLSIQSLQSFINSNQCRNNPWSYWFLFFFLDFIQCHLYTTKSPIYCYISFLKKNHMVHPDTVGPGGKNRPHKASVWEWITRLSCLSAVCFFCFVFPVCAVFGHRRPSLVKDTKVLARVHACPSVAFPTVSEFWWHAHAKSKKSNSFCVVLL